MEEGEQLRGEEMGLILTPVRQNWIPAGAESTPQYTPRIGLTYSGVLNKRTRGGNDRSQDGDDGSENEGTGSCDTGADVYTIILCSCREQFFELSDLWRKPWRTAGRVRRETAVPPIVERRTNETRSVTTAGPPRLCGGTHSCLSVYGLRPPSARRITVRHRRTSRSGRHRAGRRQSCLLYTSPSPRD